MSAHPWRWALGAGTALLLLAWGAVVVRRADDARAAQHARADAAEARGAARGDSLAVARREAADAGAIADRLAYQVDSARLAPGRVVYVTRVVRDVDTVYTVSQDSTTDAEAYVPASRARLCEQTVSACRASRDAERKRAALAERQAADYREAVDALRASRPSVYGPRIQPWGAGVYDVANATWEARAGVQVRVIGPLSLTASGEQPVRSGDRGRLVVGARWTVRW